MANPRLSVVIPCYNEAAIVQSTAETVLNFVAKRNPHYTFELILVNDGSTDATKDIITRMQATHREIELISFPSNRGRGAAIKAGIAQSRGEIVILLDADLSYDVQHVDEILDCFEKDPQLDTVVISPYMKGGVVGGVPLHRLLISRMANWILSGFFSQKFSTVTCVVRGYRGEVIRRLPLFESGKELHLEILRKLDICDYKMIEIPGRLIWKSSKAAPRRKINLNLLSAAKRHIKMGILIKPTRLLKEIAAILFLIGIFETYNILKEAIRYYEPQSDFWRSVWEALFKTFEHSPHTAVIASVCLILSFQTVSFLALLQSNTLQHEETMRHLLALLEKKKES